jgi:hypothetical protein
LKIYTSLTLIKTFLAYRVWSYFKVTYKTITIRRVISKGVWEALRAGWHGYTRIAPKITRLTNFNSGIIKSFFADAKRR